MAEISNNQKNLLNSTEGDIAPRLSPFSNLKERRAVITDEDYSSSDDAAPAPKTRASRPRSPLLFSGNRMTESQKHQTTQNHSEGGLAGDGG